MNGRVAAALAPATLADCVEDSLADALAGRDGRCLWCGGDDLITRRADIWSGEVIVRCAECGAELSGAVPRELREVAV